MIYTHSYPYTPLLSHLSSHLPTSGPLLRRIQYHAKSHNPSPTAQVLASFPSDSSPGENEPWLAAYVDLNKGPDTQLWVFSSLEGRFGPSSKLSHDENGHHQKNKTSTGSNGTNSAPEISGHEKTTAKAQLLALFTYIRVHLTPTYLAWVSTQPVVVEEEKGVKKIPPHPKASVLAGSVHENVVALICEVARETEQASLPPGESEEKGEEEEGVAGTTRKGRKLRIHRGQNVFYAKYCFPSSSFSQHQSSSKLGGEGNRGWQENYTFTDSSGVSGIQEHHLDLVKSRTNIPRSKEALLAMGGVALYHRPRHHHHHHQQQHLDTNARNGTSSKGEEGNEMPIAWAFLGFDGSMSSLHVEPEHRGIGLAGIVGKEVMKRGVDVFGETPHTTSRGISHTHETTQSTSVDIERDSSSPLVSDSQPRTGSTDGSTGVEGEAGARAGATADGDVGVELEREDPQFQPQPQFCCDHQEEWFFADVAVQNTASRRVMEKMGGESTWAVAWMVVEPEL
ncbi:hypothetical protein BDV18DRAFT_144768 [Aspergillus unguis]